MRLMLTRRYEFAAAHQLNGLRPNHKCARLHGHNYVLEITVTGAGGVEERPPDAAPGMVIDAGDIDISVRPVITRLDHQHLNGLGFNDSERYIVDHGGLGTNPIWRLQTRDNKRPDGKAEKLLTVKEILRDDLALPCVDIETDDHYVWLPEADWVTSQCDDFTSALAACLEAAGFTTMVRVVAIKPASPKAYSHILVLCGLPQRSPNSMIPLPLVPLDASVGQKPGWYPRDRIAGYRDFPVPP